MSTSQTVFYGMIKGLSLYNSNPELEQQLRLLTDRYETHFPQVESLEQQMSTLVTQELRRVPSPFLNRAFQYRHDHPEDLDLENALNRHQLKSKLWILEELSKAFPTPPAKVMILGGWLGVLTALLIERLPGWQNTQFETLDLDTETCLRADILLQDYTRNQRVKVSQADMFQQIYNHPETLLINTSCEHISPFSDWWNLLPPGQLVLLQSNDYFSEATHVNCVKDLNQFQQQAPLKQALFAGSLPTPNYTRFMLIGRKQ